MKVARWEIAALYIYCPICNSALDSPDGSQLWAPAMYGDRAGTTCECFACGCRFKLPSKLAMEVAR